MGLTKTFRLLGMFLFTFLLTAGCSGHTLERDSGSEKPMKGLRPFFVACLIVTALFAVLLLSIPQARADHEGPYIVGEEKDLTDTYYFACFEEEVALAALDIFEQFGYNPERLFLFDDVCGTLSGTVMVVGQIGEDVQVRGTNDVVRFIHALYTFERETFDVFIFTGGDAKLIQKR